MPGRLSTPWFTARADPSLSPGGLMAVLWAETLVALIFVGARFYCRVTDPRDYTFNWDWEDTWVTLAAICHVVSSALSTAVIPIFYALVAFAKGSLSEPAPTSAQVSFYLRAQFAWILLFFTCLWAAKATWLTFYYPLFRNTRRWQQNTWWFAAVVCTLGYITCFGTFLASCEPISAYFEFAGCTSPDNVARSNRSLYISTACDIATDLFLMLVPFTLLWKLRISMKKKRALILLFLSGIIIIAIAVIRLVMTLPGGNNEQNVNPKWLATFTMTESAMAVTLSCAPAFRRFLTSLGEEALRGRSRNRSATFLPETPAPVNQPRSTNTTSTSRSVQTIYDILSHCSKSPRKNRHVVETGHSPIPPRTPPRRWERAVYRSSSLDSIKMFNWPQSSAYESNTSQMV